jgi:hypothetical protein
MVQDQKLHDMHYKPEQSYWEKIQKIEVTYSSIKTVITKCCVTNAQRVTQHIQAVLDTIHIGHNILIRHFWTLMVEMEILQNYLKNFKLILETVTP